MKRTSILLHSLFLCLFFLTINQSNATIHYVDSSAVGGNDGTTWADAFTDLQAALAIAVTDDTVAVAAGTYKPDASDTTKYFNLVSGLRLFGGFAGGEDVADQAVMYSRDLSANETILSGDLGSDDDTLFTNVSDNSVRVLNVNTGTSDTVFVDGFTITGGYARGTSNDGAGIYIGSSSEVDLKKMSFEYNSAQDDGGAVYISSSSYLSIDSCFMVSNTAGGNGGAVCNSTSIKFYVSNSGFYKNYCSGTGGAFYMSFSVIHIKNSTLAHNEAGSNSGGAYLYPSGSTSDLINVMAYGNTAGSYDNIRVLTGTISVSYCNLEGSGGSGSWASNHGNDDGNNIDKNPMFVNPTECDFRIYEESPVIGAGDGIEANNIGVEQGSGEPMPNPVYVKFDASGANNGTSWADAYTDLNNAIANIIPFQGIVVAKGIYHPHATDSSVYFTAVDGLEIYGGFAGNEDPINDAAIAARDFVTNETVLSGDLNEDDSSFNYTGENSIHVIYCDGISGFTLDGFTISGGNAAGSGDFAVGGGVFTRNSSSLLLQNLKIVDNYALGSGGGVYNYYSTLEVENIMCLNNIGTGGGGFYARGGMLTLDSGIFCWNYSIGNGGGLYLDDLQSSSKITNTNMVNNEATTYAGGVYMASGNSISFINCILSNNDANSPYQNSRNSGTASWSYSYLPVNDTAQVSTTVYGTNDGNILNGLLYMAYADSCDPTLFDRSPAIGSGDPTYGNNIGYYEGAGIVFPEVVYVDSAASGNDDGTTWTDAYTSLATALNNSISGQTVVVANGTYTPDASDRNMSFAPKPYITLYGGFAGGETIDSTSIADRDIVANPTVLSGDLSGDDVGLTNNTENSYHVLYFELADSILVDGFYIKGGNANGNGTLDNGGGTYSKSSTVHFNNCNFHDNYSDNDGGALWDQNSTLEITNSTFENNQSKTRGGACAYYSTDIFASGLKVCSNSTRLYGGALYVNGAVGDIMNSTIVNNAATSWYGGGICFSTTSDALNITNTIISGNTATNAGPNIYEGDRGDNIFSYSLVGGSGGSNSWDITLGVDSGNNLDTLPYFVDVANCDLRLIDVSPAIGTGDDSLGNNIGWYQGVGIPVPTILISGSLADFGGSKLGSVTAEQGYLVDGANLTNDIEVTAPVGFQITLTSGDYTGNTDTLTITQSGGSASDSVYVRYAPTDVSHTGGDLKHMSMGADSVLLAVTGSLLLPNITRTPTFLNFGSVIKDSISAEKSYVLSGVNLDTGITIIVPSPFQATLVSGDYTGATDTLYIAAVNDSVPDTTVYVRFVPDMVANYAKNLYNESAGVTTRNVSITGTGIRLPRLFVKHDATGNNDGSSWDNAFTDLRTALAESTNGDSVFVAAGAYVPSTSFRTISFDIFNGEKIFGGFAGDEVVDATAIANRNFETNETILSGDVNGNDGSGLRSDNSYHVVMIQTTSVQEITSSTVLDGFTISGGQSDGSTDNDIGGGLYIKSGIFNKDASPTVRNIIFMDNSAASGGGLGITTSITGSSASPSFENIKFINNRAENDVVNSGGAMMLRGGIGMLTPTFQNVLFQGNQALGTSSYGGAGYIWASTGGTCNPTFTGVTFCGNSTAFRGGALYIRGGSGGSICNPKFINATFNNNNAQAVFSEHDDVTGSCDPEFINAIFWNANAVELENRDGANPTLSYCLVQGSGGSASWDTNLGADGGNNVDGDPMFIDSTGCDLRLLDGSPAEGTGDGINGDNMGAYQDTGLVSPPIIVISGVVNNFGDIVFNNISAEQSYTVSGTNLDSNLLVIGVAGFELSLTSGGAFSAEDTITLVPTSGTVNVTTIFVRFSPDTVKSYGGAIKHISTGATSKAITINGNGIGGLTGFYVKADASGNNDGTSWSDAFNDLQDALSASTTGDNIYVAAGKYIPDAVQRDATFLMRDGVKIYGGFAGDEEPLSPTHIANRDFVTNETILSGDLNGDDSISNIIDNSLHVVMANAAFSPTSFSALIDGFTISGGNADGNSLNNEDRGGGMLIISKEFNKASSPTIKNVRFVGNNGYAGGALGIYAGSTNATVNPDISAVEFINNTASSGVVNSGGAIMIFGGVGTASPKFSDVRFENNRALGTSSYGGTVYTWGSGGGKANPEFRNVTICGSSAGFRGGTFYNRADDNGSNCGPTLINVTISGSSVNSEAIFNEEKAGGILATTITNTILYNASPNEIANGGTGSPSVLISNSLIEGSGGSGGGWDLNLGTDLGGNLDDDPRFFDSNNCDLRLVQGSPAIGSGNGSLGYNIGSDQDSSGVDSTVISISNGSSEPLEYFVIYPNPSDGNFNISVKRNTTNNSMVQVYSMDGKLIRSMNTKTLYSGDVINVKLNNVDKGIYLVRLVFNDKVFTKRMIVR